MPSLITHLFITVSILLIFSERLGISKKLVILLSFFAIFPDIDMFMFHRATLHNIFVPIILATSVYILTNNIKSGLIISYYIFSHILLDTFNSGTYILYPFYDKVLNIIIGFSYKTHLVFVHKIEILNRFSSEDIRMAMISSIDIATLIIITIILIVVLIKKHKGLNS